MEFKKYPDLAIFDNGIFINEKIVVNNEVLINITVYNLGDENASGIIDFYVNDITFSNLKNSQNISLLKGTNKVITFKWQPSRKGNLTLFFLVRNSNPSEINLKNNKAEKKIDVLSKKDNPLITPILIIATSSIFSGFFLMYVVFTETGKYKLLLFLLPLYSRIKGLDIFKHKDRDRIYEYIVIRPGEHLQTLSKTLDINLNTLAYHLKVLEREEYIISYKDGVKRRFFPKKMKLPHSEVSKFYPNIIRTYNIGNVQLSEIQLQIFKIIKEYQGVSPDSKGLNGISQKRIANILAKRMNTIISKQVVNYHVKLLIEGDLIKTIKDGKKVKCYISDKFNT